MSSARRSGRMIVPGRNMMVNSAARQRLVHISGSASAVDVVLEPDPACRLVGEELEIGEAQPQDADDRPDLIADEEQQRRSRNSQSDRAQPPSPGRTLRRARFKVLFAGRGCFRHRSFQSSAGPRGQSPKESSAQAAGAEVSRVGPRRFTRHGPRWSISPSSPLPRRRPRPSASRPSDRLPRP